MRGGWIMNRDDETLKFLQRLSDRVSGEDDEDPSTEMEGPGEELAGGDTPRTPLERMVLSSVRRLRASNANEPGKLLVLQRLQYFDSAAMPQQAGLATGLESASHSGVTMREIRLRELLSDECCETHLPWAGEGLRLLKSPLGTDKAIYVAAIDVRPGMDAGMGPPVRIVLRDPAGRAAEVRLDPSHPSGTFSGGSMDSEWDSFALEIIPIKSSS